MNTLRAKILSETPPELREKVRAMSDELVRRYKEIEAIELSEEEIKAAIYQAKVAKWNVERNAEYWRQKEAEVKGKE